MPTSPALDQQWEYRRLFVIPHGSGTHRGDWKRTSAGIVANLVRTIEDLEEAAEDGWRLVRVKIEEDAQARCWLNASMKRPRPLSATTSSRAVSRPATHRQQIANTTAELLDQPLPQLGIDRAA